MAAPVTPPPKPPAPACAASIERFGLCVVRDPSTGKFLAVKETRGRGWWLPGGHVDGVEDFAAAAVRECKEEAGVDVVVVGLLRLESNVQGAPHRPFGRQRAILYCEPRPPGQAAKAVADAESERAAWVTVDDLLAAYSGKRDGVVDGPLRGNELLHWALHIEGGGGWAPAHTLHEGLEGEVPATLTPAALARLHAAERAGQARRAALAAGAVA